MVQKIQVIKVKQWIHVLLVPGKSPKRRRESSRIVDSRGRSEIKIRRQTCKTQSVYSF
jgi:hypothetical protein